jgi:ABC-type antimicrobial peptide transport system permease subunit
MQQSRLESLIEAILSTLVGFGISFLVSAILLPAMGLPISMSQNLLISAVMTVVSIARGYAVRRYAQKNLNKLTRKISYYFIKDKV